MTDPLTLVIDQGTFSTRALAFDTGGQVQAAAFRKVSLQGYGSDQVEQDAEEIAVSVDQVVAEVLDHPIVRQLGVAQTGLTTQRSSVVAWDRRSGQPLAPLLSWQDRRMAAWLQRFDPYAVTVKERTGLRLSPHYGASKLRWYLDNVPAVAAASRTGHLAFGPLAGFLVFRLLQGKPLLVDHVNASRSQLWNLSTRDWDPWLSDLFNVPMDPLPHCRPIRYQYGRLTAADIPLTAVNGDQNSAIFCLGRPRDTTAIVNIGTGAFILLLTGEKLVRHPALLAGLASSSQQRAAYLVEGTVNGAGAALQWAEQMWNLSGITQKLPAWLAQADDPPIFLNSIGGLGSPWWKPGPEPTVMGNGEPWQQAVAVLESIIFMLQANLDAMLTAGLTVNRVQVSGGLARLNGLCQRLADLAERPVYRPVETEATARGMAWLAAGQPSHWPKPGRGRMFRPQANPGLSERYRRFREAID
jgi:glycerol kinase